MGGMEAVLYTAGDTIPGPLLDSLFELGRRLPDDPDAWRGWPLLVVDEGAVHGFAFVEPDKDRLWLWSIACLPVASETLWGALRGLARSMRLRAIEGAVQRKGWRRLAGRYGAVTIGNNLRAEVL